MIWFLFFEKCGVFNQNWFEIGYAHLAVFKAVFKAFFKMLLILLVSC